MTVIKRDKKANLNSLVQALEKLCPLLIDQSEDEAVADLQKAKDILLANSNDPELVRNGISMIIDAYEGDHELMAYTIQRDSQQWTEVEELSHASSRVLSLARRLRT